MTCCPASLFQYPNSSKISNCFRQQTFLLPGLRLPLYLLAFPLLFA